MKISVIFFALSLLAIKVEPQMLSSSNEDSTGVELFRLPSSGDLTVDAETQMPGRPEWKVLSDRSNMVVVGVIEKIARLVRPEKMKATSTRLPDGREQVQLPDRREYAAGLIARLNIDDVIKNDEKAKEKGGINIFLPRWLPLEGDAHLLEGKKYVLFLRPMSANKDTFANIRIYQPDAPRNKYLQFDPTGAYMVVQGAHGAVEIIETETKVVDEIKAAVRQR